MMKISDEQQRVISVIDQWRNGMMAADPNLLKKLWDHEYSRLVYIPEESDNPLTTWEEISQYYEAIAGAADSAEWATSDITSDVLGQAAYAYLSFTVRVKLKGMDNILIFNGRSSFVLHKVGTDWKLIHYHESLSRDNSYAAWKHLWT